MDTDKFLEQTMNLYFDFEVCDHENMNSAIVSNEVFPFLFYQREYGWCYTDTIESFF